MVPPPVTSISFSDREFKIRNIGDFDSEMYGVGFNWTRSQPDGLVKYFAGPKKLTREADLFVLLPGPAMRYGHFIYRMRPDNSFRSNFNTTLLL